MRHPPEKDGDVKSPLHRLEWSQVHDGQSRDLLEVAQIGRAHAVAEFECSYANQ